MLRRNFKSDSFDTVARNYAVAVSLLEIVLYSFGLSELKANQPFNLVFYDFLVLFGLSYDDIVDAQTSERVAHRVSTCVYALHFFKSGIGLRFFSLNLL